MPVRQGFLDQKAIKAHNTAWAKDEAWKDTRGGLNPDVFKDVDNVTRQRLRDYQVGPSVLKGDKMKNHLGPFQIGMWGDGVHGAADKNSLHKFEWGGEAGQKRAHNRGSVQQAVWESGLSNIGNKDQLNQFLDRADAVKAKHGDFLKDGWTSEAIMLMRENPQQAQAPAPKAQPVAKKPETTPEPIRDSSHLAEAKERAGNFKNEAFNPTAHNPDTFDKRKTESKLATDYDFTGGASNLMTNVVSNKPSASTKPAKPDKPEPSTSSSSTDNKSPYKKPFTDMTNLPSTPTSGFIK